MAFNEANYRRLRAYLLTREGKFNWNNPYSIDPDRDPGCVACAVLRLESGFTRGQAIAHLDDVQRFLGCSESESCQIYFPYYPDERSDLPSPSVHAAIARLDEVASSYGVTPDEPPAFTPNHNAFMAELRAFASETRAAYPVSAARLQ